MNTQQENFADQSYIYIPLKDVSRFVPPPASCMRNYGIRSTRDQMDWQEYMVKEKPSTIAIPGAAGPGFSKEEYFRFNKDSPSKLMPNTPLVDKRHTRAISARRKILGTQPLAPGF